MIHIYSVEPQYDYMCSLVADTNMTLYYKDFYNIMSKYIELLLNYHCLDCYTDYQRDEFNKIISRYLTVNETTKFLDYTNKTLWKHIYSEVYSILTVDDRITIQSDSHTSLRIYITRKIDLNINPTLESVLNRICADVEQKIDSGEYIIPQLKEIYDVCNARV